MAAQPAAPPEARDLLLAAASRIMREGDTVDVSRSDFVLAGLLKQ